MKVLSSPQMVHAAVMASFNSFEGESPGRVLWRIDCIGSATYLLIQSSIRPDVHHIVDLYGRPDTGQQGESLDYDPFLSRIENGRKYRFRLVANPVHSVTTAGSKRGKVTAHVTVEQQLSWLVDRSETNGFTLRSNESDVTADVVSREVIKFRREGKTITLSRATFEGVMTVTDADSLRMMMMNGIGRAKSYGCGLFTIIPL